MRIMVHIVNICGIIHAGGVYNEKISNNFINDDAVIHKHKTCQCQRC
jgi:hypothetical protein